jgi:RNA polymerase sigma factor (sigma-70 family)
MSPLALSLRFLQAQPDHRLVELARNGHEPAFEALVRRYRAELLAYCRRLQPTTGSAEDVLQQTLLQAWKALSAGTEVREIRPWLYRIAHNASLNSLRVATAIPSEMSEAAGDQDMDTLVDQRRRIRAAFTELAALPTLQRQAFVSSTLDGASHDEVAASLGMSSGAVRGLIYRARSAMRAAAAALTPSPVLGWAVRHAETQTGGAATVGQALAGGGGTGLVAALAKGGAVITLAGAVAGAGGAVFTPAQPKRHTAPAREIDFSQQVRAPGGQPAPVRASILSSPGGRGSARGAGPTAPHWVLVASGSHSATSGRSGTSGRRRGRPADGSVGSGDGSGGRSDGGPGPSAGSGGSSAGSGSPGGGSAEGGSGASGHDSSGGPDGGSSGPGSGSGAGIATIAGTDGGSGGSRSGTSGGDRTTTSTPTSGDGSGSLGTSGGGSNSASGSGPGSDPGSGSGSSSSSSASSSTAGESH